MRSSYIFFQILLETYFPHSAHDANLNLYIKYQVSEYNNITFFYFQP